MTANSPMGKDNKMHPEDLRNMIIFFVLAAAVYFGYNHYVLQPQRAATKAAQDAKLALENNPQSPLAQKLAAVKNPLPRDEVLNTQAAQRVTIENDAVLGSISTKGARIDDLTLKQYFETMKKERNVALLSPNQTQLPRHIEYGWAASDASIALPNKETIWQIQGNASLTPDSPVTLSWNNGKGLKFERVISIDDRYMVSISQNVTNTGRDAVILYPYGLISQRGIPSDFAATWFSHEGPIGYIGDTLEQHSYKSMRKQSTAVAENAQQGWLGMTDKYWLTAMIPPQDQSVKYSFNYAGPEKKDPDNIGRYQVDFLGAPVTLSAGASQSFDSRLFIGAKEVITLQKYEKDQNIPKLDLAVNFGFLWFLSKPFFYFLHYAGIYIGNFGVAIIVLTVLIRGAVFPLTNMSYRSFAGMKKVGPQIVEMRDKYSDDKQKLQQELVGLYKKEGVNPMSGCLPILLQIPIFFALYRVLFMTIEMRHAPFFGWIHDLSAADPTNIFTLFGMIPWDPPSMMHIGLWPCFMLLIMLVQKNLNPPPQDKMQKDIATYMPFFFAFIMGKFAAGLVVYWTFSALIGVIQQIIIMKSMNVPIHLFGETKEDEALDDAIDKGPAVHPLAEMAEDQLEDALIGDNGHEGDDDTPPPAKKAIKPPKPKKSKKKK